jgi:hypothetical protein
LIGVTRFSRRGAFKVERRFCGNIHVDPEENCAGRRLRRGERPIP